MDYKEKYEIGLEGIQEILGSGEDSIKMSRLKLRLQGIFPELKESEDERIRKSIIRVIKGNMPDNDYRKEYLAWLEKQDEQKPAEWNREDEQNLNACFCYIPDGFLRRWLNDIIHVKYDKSAELPKGKDYGIDGLYAAIDILQKTLGKVDGYQTDDGILEHECAISAVKKLYEQKHWKPSDEQMAALNDINLTGSISYVGQGQELISLYNFLKKLREE